MSLCLSSVELADLTDYKRRDRQIHALVLMGYPFKIAPTGAIKVLRSDVESGKRGREKEPDYDAI